MALDSYDAAEGSKAMVLRSFFRRYVDGLDREPTAMQGGVLLNYLPVVLLSFAMMSSFEPLIGPHEVAMEHGRRYSTSCALWCHQPPLLLVLGLESGETSYSLQSGQKNIDLGWYIFLYTL